MRASRNRHEKGNAIIEFGLSMLILIPILFGTVSFGINLGNVLQSTQIARDMGHMYAQGVDFSLAQNQNIAVNLVQGLGGMTTTAGNGVLVLSQVVEVYQADCAAAGFTVGQCTNLGSRVFTNRIVIGNNGLRTSDFGTPTGVTISSKGNISGSDYLTKGTDVVSGFTDSVLPQADGQVAYVVEAYFSTPSLAFLGGFSNDTGGVYSRAIF
jgi:Flp pilus assembly protein TadG